jgi:tRNA threonylcarbamoyladenosine biosynthesis protein TsaB
MALILALDTTSAVGSLALLRDGVTMALRAMEAPDGFGHVLFGEVERLLKESGVGLTAVDCFAAASGPGSFTGVRIGLTAAKGFAETLSRPAVAVSTLRALASYGSGPCRAAVIDARRDEVYAGLFGAALEPLQPEWVGPLDRWLIQVPAPAEFVVREGERFPALTTATVAPLAIADAVGRLAWREYAAGHAGNALALDANYVRRSDAELNWKEV